MTDLPDITFTIEGFKTEKEFIQHLCRHIISLGIDIENNNQDNAARRLESLRTSASYYLLINGDGVTHLDMRGVHKPTELDII